MQENPNLWPLPPVWPRDLPVILELLGLDEFRRWLATLTVGPDGRLVRMKEAPQAEN